MRVVERSPSGAPGNFLLLQVGCAIALGSGCGTNSAAPGAPDAGGGVVDASYDAGSLDSDAGGAGDVDAGGDLDASGDVDAGPDPECPPVCPSGMCVHGDCVRRVFVTSEAVTGGSIGGLAGADATCQRLADAAGLGGRYRAWLAEPLDWPEHSFTRSRAPYVRVDGAEVAENWTDLTDGIPGRSKPTETAAAASASTMWKT